MITPTHSVTINPHSGKGELTVLFGGHAQTPPLHDVGPKVVDYHLVHYVLSGKGRFSCAGHEYTLEKGASFYIFPGELTAYVSDETDPWSYRWIGFKGTRADEFLSTLGISINKPVVQSPFSRKVSSLYRHVEQTLLEGPAGCDMEAGAYLRLIFAELARHRTSTEPLKEEISAIRQQVDQAIRWLTLQYYQPVSIEQMAQTLGYHRTHLSKMFKQYTGMSPSQFLLKIRMERAKLLLLEPLTVEQVASSVGFTDALYFSKQFKKWYGSSPSDYRCDQNFKPYDCAT
ncbi:helix-turn-helix transcriptional regulator [Paenibacillus thalictri]|uniref:AraC family transcriptional regulator n=1 Tax=Paenibacillus thalictri TaxID=2527873 RepID=A0A4Q9DXT3_9BACL|nr:AraC family transcriptional regulator [Paenibacillus thalictri]TBL81195.1 AraC family transcriptional regulator [Paenibacillus thalictri]